MRVGRVGNRLAGVVVARVHYHGSVIASMGRAWELSRNRNTWCTGESATGSLHMYIHY